MNILFINFKHWLLYKYTFIFFTIIIGFLFWPFVSTDYLFNLMTNDSNLSILNLFIEHNLQNTYVNILLMKYTNFTFFILALLFLFVISRQLINIYFAFFIILSYLSSLSANIYFRASTNQVSVSFLLFIALYFLFIYKNKDVILLKNKYKYKYKNKIISIFFNRKNLLLSMFFTTLASLQSNFLTIFAMQIIFFIVILNNYRLNKYFSFIDVFFYSFSFLFFLFFLFVKYYNSSYSFDMFIVEYILQQSKTSLIFSNYLVVLLLGTFPMSFFLIPSLLMNKNSKIYEFNKILQIMLFILLLFSFVFQTLTYFFVSSFFIIFISASFFYEKLETNNNFLESYHLFFVILSLFLSIIIILVPIIGLHPEWLIPLIHYDYIQKVLLYTKISWNYTDCLFGISFFIILCLLLNLLKNSHKKMLIISLLIFCAIIINMSILSFSNKFEAYYNSFKTILASK